MRVLIAPKHACRIYTHAYIKFTFNCLYSMLNSAVNHSFITDEVLYNYTVDILSLVKMTSG